MWPVTVAAGAVALAAVAYLVFAPPTEGGEVVEGADVIAVIPFDAGEEDVELQGANMVRLLSMNLDELGEIRTSLWRPSRNQRVESRS